MTFGESETQLLLKLQQPQLRQQAHKFKVTFDAEFQKYEHWGKLFSFATAEDEQLFAQLVQQYTSANAQWNTQMRSATAQPIVDALNQYQSILTTIEEVVRRGSAIGPLRVEDRELIMKVLLEPFRLAAERQATLSSQRIAETAQQAAQLIHGSVEPLIVEARNLSSDVRRIGEDLKKSIEITTSGFGAQKDEIVASLAKSDRDAAALREEARQGIQAVGRHVDEEITKGIERLINIKTELELSGDFSGSIKTRLEAAKRSEKWSFWAMIALAVALVAVLSLISVIPAARDLAWHQVVLLRVSILVPMLWVMTFLNRHYRVAKLASLKYAHLASFLGGGATHLQQLLQNDKEMQQVTRRRLAEMFLSLDEIMTTFQGDEKIENAVGSVEKANSVVKSTTEVASKAIEVFSKMSKDK